MRSKSGRYRRIYISDDLERLHSEYVWQLCDADAHRAVDLENHFVFVNLHRGQWLAPLRSETVYDQVTRAETQARPESRPAGRPIGSVTRMPRPCCCRALASMW